MYNDLVIPGDYVKDRERRRILTLFVNEGSIYSHPPCKFNLENRWMTIAFVFIQSFISRYFYALLIKKKEEKLNPLDDE